MTLLPVPDVAIIVVAAGAGTRLGGERPKAFVGIDDRSILRHALGGVFAAAPAQVIVVVPEGYEGAAETEVDSAAGIRSELTRVVTGGGTRQQSVAAGLAALWGEITTVLVHDAARALTPPRQIDAVVAAVREGEGDGAIPALPVVDTLQRVEGDVVAAAVDRAGLVAAQTPQGFPRDRLLSAYARASEQGEEYTDDAALFAAAGFSVRRVPGDPQAFKITTPEDLDRARLLLRPAERIAVPRIGIGTDAHAFGGSGRLRLAGLEWPEEPALSGHSDGDAIAHAIVDALLNAAGLGDIGAHFGADHPEYAGAHAEVFLERTRGIVAAAGFAIGNVAVQFQGNRPRFGARRREAEEVLSRLLGAPVSVAATTTDGLGFTGRDEGVSVTAVALVIPAG